MFVNDRLIILDADGTTVDAFSAINRTFQLNNMDIGDIERFQKRRNIFKYLGGLKELPKNLRKQLKGHKLSEIVKARERFNIKILELALLVLRFCSIKSLKSHPNMDVIFG